MAPATTKACVLCGTEYSTKRPDRAKYCSFCAAANAILHYGLDTHPCVACEEPFALTGRRDILCAACDHNPRFCRAVVSGTCIACHRAGVNLADAEIPVCFFCWKSPTKRQWLIKELARKRASRIAAHANPNPERTP